MPAGSGIGRLHRTVAVIERAILAGNAPSPLLIDGYGDQKQATTDTPTTDSQQEANALVNLTLPRIVDRGTSLASGFYNFSGW